MFTGITTTTDDILLTRDQTTIALLCCWFFVTFVSTKGVSNFFIASSISAGETVFTTVLPLGPVTSSSSSWWFCHCDGCGGGFGFGTSVTSSWSDFSFSSLLLSTCWPSLSPVEYTSLFLSTSTSSSCSSYCCCRFACGSACNVVFPLPLRYCVVFVESYIVSILFIATLYHVFIGHLMLFLR